LIFKKFFFVVLLMLAIFSPAVQAEIVCDFDGSGLVDDNDLAILIGWKQLINAGVTADKITVDSLYSVSRNVLSSVSGVARIPVLSKDNLTDEAQDSIDDEDLAFFIAYKQLENAGAKNFSFDTVRLVAINILSNISRSMGKAPGSPIGDSVVPVTITGIQVDPQ